jgi:DNA-binding transcriptional ArsR family regulator
MARAETAGSVEVLDDARRVATLLSPLRRRILESLDRPASATALARRLGLPRQKVNYHLRELERGGFVELAEKRRRRGCVERRLRLASRAYVLDPVLLGKLAADPDQLRDRFSSAFLVAVASRLVRDVALLRERARTAGKRLTTLTLEGEISVASPADLTRFTQELTGEVARLAAKYDRPRSRQSRRYRIVLGAHPKVTKTAEQAAAETKLHGEGGSHEGNQD